jgi:hypothetical protein
MNLPIDDQAYVAALDAARVELGEILAKFEVMQVRRERMQNIIEALKPLIDSGQPLIARDQEAAGSSSEPGSEPTAPQCFVIQNQAEFTPIAKEQAQDNSLDTIQRRISSALGMAAVA